MSFFQTNQFDASKVEPAQGFDPLPEGDYVVMVETAEEKKCAKNGEQLVLRLRVMAGQYAKRTVFARITLRNQSAKATEIGYAQLSAFCRAVGVITPKAVFEFCNKQLIVHVKVVTRQDNGQLTNDVKSYKPTSAQAAGIPQVQQAAAPAPWAVPAAAPAPASIAPAVAAAQAAQAASAPAALPQKPPWAR